MSTRRTVLMASLGLCLVGLAAVAGANDDWGSDAARQALIHGETLPLTKILAITAQQVPGDVIKVELEGKHHRLVYKIKVLAHDGRIRKVKLDARTGKVLEIEDENKDD